MNERRQMQKQNSLDQSKTPKLKCLFNIKSYHQSPTNNSVLENHDGFNRHNFLTNQTDDPSRADYLDNSSHNVGIFTKKNSHEPKIQMPGYDTNPAGYMSNGIYYAFIGNDTTQFLHPTEIDVSKSEEDQCQIHVETSELSQLCNNTNKKTKDHPVTLADINLRRNLLRKKLFQRQNVICDSKTFNSIFSKTNKDISSIKDKGLGKKDDNKIKCGTNYYQTKTYQDPNCQYDKRLNLKTELSQDNGDSFGNNIGKLPMELKNFESKVPNQSTFHKNKYLTESDFYKKKNSLQGTNSKLNKTGNGFYKKKDRHYNSLISEKSSDSRLLQNPDPPTKKREFVFQQLRKNRMRMTVGEVNKPSSNNLDFEDFLKQVNTLDQDDKTRELVENKFRKEYKDGKSKNSSVDMINHNDRVNSIWGRLRNVLIKRDKDDSKGKFIEQISSERKTNYQADSPKPPANQNDIYSTISEVEFEEQNEKYIHSTTPIGEKPDQSRFYSKSLYDRANKTGRLYRVRVNSVATGSLIDQDEKSSIKSEINCEGQIEQNNKEHVDNNLYKDPIHKRQSITKKLEIQQKKNRISKIVNQSFRNRQETKLKRKSLRDTIAWRRDKNCEYRQDTTYEYYRPDNTYEYQNTYKKDSKKLLKREWETTPKSSSFYLRGWVPEENFKQASNSPLNEENNYTTYCDSMYRRHNSTDIEINKKNPRNNCNKVNLQLFDNTKSQKNQKNQPFVGNQYRYISLNNKNDRSVERAEERANKTMNGGFNWKKDLKDNKIAQQTLAHINNEEQNKTMNPEYFNHYDSNLNVNTNCWQKFLAIKKCS